MDGWNALTTATYHARTERRIVHASGVEPESMAGFPLPYTLYSRIMIVVSIFMPLPYTLYFLYPSQYCNTAAMIPLTPMPLLTHSGILNICTLCYSPSAISPTLSP